MNQGQPDNSARLTLGTCGVRILLAHRSGSCHMFRIERESQINGTVTSIDHASHEPSEWNWFLIVLLLPLFGIFLLPLFILWRMFSSRSSTGSLTFFALGYLQRGKKEVPVQYFRVRDGQNIEHLIRRKGYLVGHVMPGDRVEVQGRIREGVLYLSRGRNVTTGSSLTVRQRGF